MNFGQAVKTCFSKYATFEGRAPRPEYWWFFLFEVLVLAAASLLSEVVYGLVSLGFVLPALAVGARRLHDIGRSGWWQLLYLVPLVGWLVLLYWAVQPGQPQANAYGPPPVATGTAVLPPGAA